MRSSRGSPSTVSFATTSTLRGAGARGDVGDHVLDRAVARGLADLVDQVAAQPAGLRLRMRGHDQLVDLLLRDDVLHRVERPRREDPAVRRNTRSAERLDGAVETTAHSRATEVLVDDVAGTRLVDRSDDHRARSGPARHAPHGHDQLVADQRLVGDDEDDLCPSLSRCLLWRRRPSDRVPRPGHAVLVRTATTCGSRRS